MKKETIIVIGGFFPAGGTSLQGEIDISYQDIIAKLGKPNAKTDKYKIDAVWHLLTPAGIATLYNYKTGKNYLGKEGLPLKEIRDWHIGGKTKEVVQYVIDFLTK